MPKLLVIDDEPSIRFSIEQVFADDGIEVLGAETADEGLRLAAEESPDVDPAGHPPGRPLRAGRLSTTCAASIPRASSSSSPGTERPTPPSRP